MKRFLDDEIIRDKIDSISPVKLIVKPYRKARTRLGNKDEKSMQLTPMSIQKIGLSSQLKPVRIKRESLMNETILAVS